jgi:hypothetical protein
MLKSYKLNSRVAPRRLLAASLLLPLTIIIADAQQTSGTARARRDGDDRRKSRCHCPPANDEGVKHEYA